MTINQFIWFLIIWLVSFLTTYKVTWQRPIYSFDDYLSTQTQIIWYIKINKTGNHLNLICLVVCFITNTSNHWHGQPKFVKNKKLSSSQHVLKIVSFIPISKLIRKLIKNTIDPKFCYYAIMSLERKVVSLNPYFKLLPPPPPKENLLLKFS